MRTRRILSILPAAAIAVTLAACGSSSSGGTPTPSGSTSWHPTRRVRFTDRRRRRLHREQRPGADVRRPAREGRASPSTSRRSAAPRSSRARWRRARSRSSPSTPRRTPTRCRPRSRAPRRRRREPESSDHAEAPQEVRDQARADLTWTPSKAVDQNAFAVTKTFATSHNLTTLSDLGSSGVSVKLGAPAECSTRPFCQPGLKHTYGIKISGLVPLDFDSLPLKQAVKTGNGPARRGVDHRRDARPARPRCRFSPTTSTCRTPTT